MVLVALSLIVTDEVVVVPLLNVLSYDDFTQPLWASLQACFIVLSFFVQVVDELVAVPHVGGVLSMFNLAFSCDSDSVT